MISVRGSGAEPTTAASAGLGVRAFMKAALGVRFFAGAAALSAAVFAGAFFAVAMLGFSFLDINLHQRKAAFPLASRCYFEKNGFPREKRLFLPRFVAALTLAAWHGNE